MQLRDRHKAITPIVASTHGPYRPNSWPWDPCHHIFIVACYDGITRV